MIEAVMLWNEPNNISHWDFHLDQDWKIFAAMIIAAARAIRRVNPELKIVLGGMSPVDPNFVRLLGGHGVLDEIDVVAIHGFPLDWNHWSIHEWPHKVEEIRNVTNKPVWVSEAGASSFGAEEIQVFGLKRTAERSEEHTSELQSQSNIVCRLLLEKKTVLLASPPTMANTLPMNALPLTTLRGFSARSYQAFSTHPVIMSFLMTSSQTSAGCRLGRA